MQEYQANPIADDLDDEKNIYRAQIRAKQKIFNERKRSIRTLLEETSDHQPRGDRWKINEQTRQIFWLWS